MNQVSSEKTIKQTETPTFADDTFSKLTNTTQRSDSDGLTEYDQVKHYLRGSPLLNPKLDSMIIPMP